MKRTNLITITALLVIALPLTLFTLVQEQNTRTRAQQATDPTETPSPTITETPSATPSATLSPQQFPTPTEVIPTLYCLGSCPDLEPTEEASASPTPTSEVVPTENLTPEPTLSETPIDPCAPNESGVQGYGHKKRKSQDGFLRQIIKFQFKIIEVLIGKLGVQSPTPAPTVEPTAEPTTEPTIPADPEPTPTVDPCASPTEVPEPTEQPEPTIEVTPTIEVIASPSAALEDPCKVGDGDRDDNNNKDIDDIEDPDYEKGDSDKSKHQKKHKKYEKSKHLNLDDLMKTLEKLMNPGAQQDVISQSDDDAGTGEVQGKHHGRHNNGFLEKFILRFLEFFIKLLERIGLNPQPGPEPCNPVNTQPTVVPTVTTPIPTGEVTPEATPSSSVTPTTEVTPQQSAQNGLLLPAQVSNLAIWKLTLPTGAKEKPTEILQPALATYKSDPYFVAASGGIRFRAPVNGVSTSGSGYPRSELREMSSNGSSLASWTSSTGTHTMLIDEAITAVPATKKHVVAGQIHDANDDVIVIRLEDKKLFIDVNGTDGPTLDANYTLGKRFTVKFEVKGGKTNIYYNGGATPAYTMSKSYSGAYFKAGAYTQSNCSTDAGNCSASNYGEVIIYNLQVTHQ